MTDTTHPGLRPFDSVSPASARASGKRHPSESNRRTPARGGSSAAAGAAAD